MLKTKWFYTNHTCKRKHHTSIEFSTKLTWSSSCKYLVSIHVQNLLWASLIQAAISISVVIKKKKVFSILTYSPICRIFALNHRSVVLVEFCKVNNFLEIQIYNACCNFINASTNFTSLMIQTAVPFFSCTPLCMNGRNFSTVTQHLEGTSNTYIKTRKWGQFTYVFDFFLF